MAGEHKKILHPEGTKGRIVDKTPHQTPAH
jgi:hypothetical protein